jgi:hypothetical protein
LTAGPEPSAVLRTASMKGRLLDELMMRSPTRAQNPLRGPTSSAEVTALHCARGKPRYIGDALSVRPRIVPRPGRPPRSRVSFCRTCLIPQLNRAPRFGPSNIGRFPSLATRSYCRQFSPAAEIFRPQSADEDAVGKILFPGPPSPYERAFSSFGPSKIKRRQVIASRKIVHRNNLNIAGTLRYCVCPGTTLRPPCPCFRARERSFRCFPTF